MLDAIFTEESTALPASDIAAPTFEDSSALEVPPIIAPQGSIEGIIHRYATAYTNRDLSGLMATISPSYLRDGEDYEQLRKKMADVFRRFTQIDFSLEKLRIQGKIGTARVGADYLVILTPAGSSPTVLSGKLFFTLTESENGWQISRIDTQGR